MKRALAIAVHFRIQSAEQFVSRADQSGFRHVAFVRGGHAPKYFDGSQTFVRIGQRIKCFKKTLNGYGHRQTLQPNFRQRRSYQLGIETTTTVGNHCLYAFPAWNRRSASANCTHTWRAATMTQVKSVAEWMADL